ncbi:MAG: MFS transporter [Candidatus Heimdallarchaeota archaeon]|nr:MFS transporter [Candidatus Heimdallarchaeota archaeon]
MSAEKEIAKGVDRQLELTPVTEEEIEIETKTSKLNVLNWSMYDLANTIYSMVIVSLIINQYALIIGQVELGLSYTRADMIYNIVFAVMQIVVAVLMPVMGALSDTAGKRKPFVLGLTGVILLFASLLGIYHSLALVLIFYVIANMAYQFSLTFYDSMIAFIANPKDVGKVGGFGVAFGYFGTLIGMGVMLGLQSIWGSPVSQITENEPVLQYGYYGVPWTFVIAMGLFALCAIPFIFVKERQKKGKVPPFGQLAKNAFRQVGQTFRDITSHKEMFKFIIGYFLVVDVANIIVAKMFLIVRDGLLMDVSFSMIFIIISTVSAVAFTYFIGMIADIWDAKIAFFVIGGLWGIAIIMGVLLIFFAAPVAIGFNFPFIMVILMGLIAGPALGGTWVAQRAMITELAPKEKFGEYFGFSKLSGKVSASLGPLVWSGVFLLFEAIAGALYGSYNLYKAYGYAMIVTGLIMAIGLAIIATVKPSKKLVIEGEQAAKQEG